MVKEVIGPVCEETMISLGLNPVTIHVIWFGRIRVNEAPCQCPRVTQNTVLEETEAQAVLTWVSNQRDIMLIHEQQLVGQASALAWSGFFGK